MHRKIKNVSKKHQNKQLILSLKLRTFNKTFFVEFWAPIFRKKNFFSNESHLKMMKKYFYFILKALFALNSKTARWWGQIALPCGFSKNVCCKERVKPWFFVALNNSISHIFPENIIEIPQVVQKLWRIYLSILAIFINFLNFSTFLCYKETNDLSYNKWCQHFFTFILQIDC